MNFTFLQKITTALGTSSVTLQFLQALFSPRLWIYTLLWSSGNRFVKLFISKCSTSTALGLKSMTTAERWLKKANMFGHICFRQQVCLHIRAVTWPTAQLTSTQLMVGSNPSPDTGGGKLEVTAQGIIWFSSELTAHTA